MSNVSAISYPVREQEDPAYLFAQDALVAALRYLFAEPGERAVEAIRASSAAAVAWDIAPPAVRRRMPVDMHRDLDDLLACPAEEWLPYAGALGVRGVRFMIGGCPAPVCHSLAREYLPHVIGGAYNSGA